MRAHHLSVGDRSFEVRFTEASDGDFQIDSDSERLAVNRSRIVDYQWSWVRQVHSSRVVRVSQPVGYAGEADALVTSARLVPISITTADCMPIVMVGNRNIAVVHAGWRGLTGGVLEETVEEIRRDNDSIVSVLLGPHIGVADYEFGSSELTTLAARFGDEIRGETSAGTPALDLYNVLTDICETVRIPKPEKAENTADEAFYSHRVRGQPERQALVAWIS